MKYIIAIIFYIAMAMLESAVVIYLRELYYPSGFDFPLSKMKDLVILTELIRELATIVMLWTTGYLFGRNFSSRWAWFLIGFGIWDIFYYVFLYLIIQWPATILDWDILFLIPTPWYGPVIAPVLISIAMIGFGMVILRFDFLNKIIIWDRRALFIFFLGCMIALYTFLADFIWTLKPNPNLNFSESVLIHSQNFIPRDYNYDIFFIAYGLILIGITIFIRKNCQFMSKL